MTGDETVIRWVCDRINQWERKPCLFLPASGEENAWSGMPDRLAVGTVETVAGPVRLRSYVDGSYTGQVLFEVRCKIGSGDPAGAVSLLGWFDALVPYMEECVPGPTGGRIYSKCRAISQGTRSAVKSDGTKEYSASFRLEYRQTTAEHGL